VIHEGAAQDELTRLAATRMLIGDEAGDGFETSPVRTYGRYCRSPCETRPLLAEPVMPSKELPRPRAPALLLPGVPANGVGVVADWSTGLATGFGATSAAPCDPLTLTSGRVGNIGSLSGGPAFGVTGSCDQACPINPSAAQLPIQNRRR
jgi:hypothetical protein